MDNFESQDFDSTVRLAPIIIILLVQCKSSSANTTSIRLSHHADSRYAYISYERGPCMDTAHSEHKEPSRNADGSHVPKLTHV